MAQGDGPARGRELEIADLLAFIKRAGIRNTLWLTADVHYTAAHHYDPEQGRVPGLRAVLGVRLGAAACRQLPAEQARQHVRAAADVREGAGRAPNQPPSDGLQFFGQVAIDGATQVMTVTLKDVEDRALWSTKLEPKLG